MSAMSATTDDARRSHADEMPTETDASRIARPSTRRQVFASVLTPHWSLGLLLFVCLSLPAYRGCQGEVVYVGAVFQEVEPTAESFYLTFLITWPFFFGLLVGIGTLWIVLSGDTQKARWLWRMLAGLVVVNLLLLIPAMVVSLANLDSPEELSRQLRESWWWTVPSTAALALVVITARRCRDPFTAAMWLQAGLAVLAAISVSVVTPGFLLATRFLIGGQLAVAASVCLILATVVALLDGRRALARRVDESPLQLSLRSTLMLMLAGGVACCWIGTFLLAEVPVE